MRYRVPNEAFLRGLDPHYWDILQRQARGERWMFLSLAVGMDEFQRGVSPLPCVSPSEGCVVVTGTFAAYSQSNALYVWVLNTLTRGHPMLTVSLMDGRFPLTVFGEILARQFDAFAGSLLRMTTITHVPSYDSLPIRHAHPDDVVRHVDGRLYVVHATNVCYMLVHGLADLPVFKAVQGRLKPGSLCNHSKTFEHKEQSDDDSIPPFDHRKNVPSALVRRLARFMTDVQERRGRDRIGRSRVHNEWRSCLGVADVGSPLRNMVASEQFQGAELMHIIPQNAGALAVTCLLAIAAESDKGNVSTNNF